MARSTPATRYIREAAERSRASGVTVDCDSSYSTVAIDWPDSEGCFMQGDEADAFIAERDALCKRFRSLEFSVAELALAEPYVECLS